MGAFCHFSRLLSALLEQLATLLQALLALLHPLLHGLLLGGARGPNFAVTTPTAAATMSSTTTSEPIIWRVCDRCGPMALVRTLAGNRRPR
jgi:hypothetical protein